MATEPDPELGTTGPSSSRGTAVLVHGTWAGPHDWRWVRTLLEDAGVEVHAPDLPSHHDASAGLAEDAAAVRGVVEHAARPVVVVGWSYGAEVVSVAADGLSDVTRLVYVADTPRPASDRPRDDGWVEADPLVLVSGPWFVLDESAWPDPETVRPPFPDHVLAHLREHPRRPAARGAASGPQTAEAWRSLPTTVLMGVHDQLVTDEDRRTLAEQVEGVADVRWVDTDHFIPWREPRVVADVVLDALGSAERKTRPQP